MDFQMPLLNHLTMLSPHNVLKRKSLSKIIFLNFPLDSLTCSQWGVMPWLFLSQWRTSLGALPTTNFPWTVHVTTLALGSWLKQGAWKGSSQKYNPGITFTLWGMQENVREWTHTFPSGLPLWELESQWTFEFSQSNLMHQNSLDWKVLYTIGKLLRHKCLKLACMIHLSTKNINYGR